MCHKMGVRLCWLAGYGFAMLIGARNFVEDDGDLMGGCLAFSMGGMIEVGGH